MTEEERKRRGLQLTDEYERYVQDVLSARAAGVNEPRPITQVDTDSGPEYRTLQKYVDPRDEMIASSPALVRPAYSILDRMLRPGRAGMADRMNREYMEGLLQRDSDQRRALAERQLIEAQGQKMQADAAVAGLQRTVAEGGAGAKEAADRLREIGLATGRVAPQGQDLHGMLFDQEKRSQRGVAKPVSAEGATPTAPATVTPALTNISDMTPTEFREASAAKGAELDSAIAEQQKIIDTGMLPKLAAGSGAYGAGYQYVPPKVVGSREATIKELDLAKARLKELQAQKQQLESTAELYSPTGSRQ
tara:strand:+ start:211 stop:1128 length:918 start_codon:yes stop_codon:yes gene_type:complete